MNKTICFVTSSLQGGGAQRVLVNIANQFAEDGWTTHIICFVSKNTPALYVTSKKIKLHYLPRGYTIKDKIISKCSKMFMAIINEISPDVLIPFLMPVTAYTYYAAKKLGIKIIVSERNDPYSTPVDPFWRKRRDYIFKHADGCVFQTQSACNYYDTTAIKKSVVIRNPVDLSCARNDIIKSIDRSHRIVCLAKYEPQKNLEFLIDTFYDFLKTHPDYELDIYGNDYHRRRLSLKQKAIAMGIDKKVHLNDVRQDIYDIIYNAKMCVLPSKYEGMPNALIESVCLGIPSIASDCPAYSARQIIKPGENGFLFPVDNKEAFLEKMICLADDDLVSDSFTIEGMKTRSQFDVKQIYNEWNKFVTLVLEQK